MKTYQDLQDCVTEKERMDFIESAIFAFQSSERYQIACDAELYAIENDINFQNI